MLEGKAEIYTPGSVLTTCPSLKSRVKASQAGGMGRHTSHESAKCSPLEIDLLSCLKKCYWFYGVQQRIPVIFELERWDVIIGNRKLIY